MRGPAVDNGEERAMGGWRHASRRLECTRGRIPIATWSIISGVVTAVGVGDGVDDATGEHRRSRS